MKIEILKGKSGKWYWRIKALNGKIICHSETYSSKRKALNTARKLELGISAHPNLTVVSQ